jgi:general secretion pathway protein A
VARAQENPAAEQDHLACFGLARPPFAPLSDPREIHDAEQYSLLSRHLDAAARNADHLVVVRGADGSGKTTLLNRYVTSLGEDTFFATVDQSCESGTAFYCTFLQQLGFDGITGKPGELRHITNEFLIHRARARGTVLLIIDNVHHVRPSVLEQLRSIAATRHDGQRVISSVMTGNAHIRRIMDSPAMDGLRFREFVDFHIRAYTESQTGAYIRHRLHLAGDTAGATFEPDSYAMIHRYSGGIPGQINMLGSALLTEAAQRKMQSINGDLVRWLAESRKLPPYVIPAKGKGRRKSDGATGQARMPDHQGVAIAARSTPAPSSPQTVADPPTRGNPRIDTNDLLTRLARVSEQVARLE